MEKRPNQRRAKQRAGSVYPAEFFHSRRRERPHDDTLRPSSAFPTTSTRLIAPMQDHDPENRDARCCSGPKVMCRHPRSKRTSKDVSRVAESTTEGSFSRDHSSPRRAKTTGSQQQSDNDTPPTAPREHRPNFNGRPRRPIIHPRLPSPYHFLPLQEDSAFLRYRPAGGAGLNPRHSTPSPPHTSAASQPPPTHPTISNNLRNNRQTERTSKTPLTDRGARNYILMYICPATPSRATKEKRAKCRISISRHKTKQRREKTVIISPPPAAPPPQTPQPPRIEIQTAPNTPSALADSYKFYKGPLA